MGTITRSLANNVTTGGVVTSSAINNSSVTSITSFASISGGSGSWNILSTATASSSASIEFTSNIDSTYNLYVLDWHGVAPATDVQQLYISFSTDGGSTYAAPMVIHSLREFNDEITPDSDVGFGTGGGGGGVTTSPISITGTIGNDSDHSSAGQIWLANPSNTSLVKMVKITTISNQASDFIWTGWMDGFINTTSAVNGIKLNAASGNLAVGNFRLYGIDGV
jgi:hypothetical protein